MSHIVDQAIDAIKAKLDDQPTITIITGDEAPSANYDKKRGINEIRTPNDPYIMLHEYIHMWHFQTFPILFSSSDVIGVDFIELKCEIKPIFNTARDWFVYAELNKLCPDDFRTVILKDYKDYLTKVTKDDSENNQLILGLIFASANHWFKQDIPDFKNKDIIVNGLLSVDPCCPKVEKLKQIVNDLLKLYSKYDHIEEFNCWEVTKIDNLITSYQYLLDSLKKEITKYADEVQASLTAHKITKEQALIKIYEYGKGVSDSSKKSILFFMCLPIPGDRSIIEFTESILSGIDPSWETIL